jgi:multicomponent Na+:H+ antiporter subunit E
MLFIALLMFWVMLNGSLASDFMVVGVIAALVIALMFRRGLGLFSELRTSPRALTATVLYFFFFIKELVKANLTVARIVLAPDLPLKPGIVTVRTKLTSAMGRMLLANSITLTPGTLTVDLEGDLLHIHCVAIDDTDVESATAAIVAGFEHYLEVMYG